MLYNGGLIFVFSNTMGCMKLSLGFEVRVLISCAISNTGKVLKCGAGEGWRRSVGPIM